MVFKLKMKTKDKSQKKVDDVYALVFARPVSKRISDILYGTKVTPNQISVIGVLLGILSAVFILTGNFIIAALVLYLSFVADCVDGELARLRNQFTKTGFWLESSLDSLSLLVPLVAVGYASEQWVLLSFTVSFMLLTRIRMMASDMASLKYNLNLKEGIIKNPVKRILWQLRYGNSVQYMILIIFLLFSRLDLVLWLTLILAGGYYLVCLLYEIKFYSSLK
jgi:phosphatidylglycerophosphate synthase